MATAVPNVSQVGSVPFDPAQISGAVQAPITTSSEQLKGILAANSPLMQQAATAGNQQAAKRGLLNSSMGVQASQNALIGAAAPIAQQDAAALNQGNQFNTSAANNVNNANATFQQDANKTNAYTQNSINQWNAGQANEALFKTLDVNSREQLAGIEANYKQLMQVNQGASDLYSQVMKNINEIQLSANVLDKATEISNQLAWLRGGMNMIGNLNNIQSLVNFSA